MSSLYRQLLDAEGHQVLAGIAGGDFRETMPRMACDAHSLPYIGVVQTPLQDVSSLTSGGCHSVPQPQACICIVPFALTMLYQAVLSPRAAQASTYSRHMQPQLRSWPCTRGNTDQGLSDEQNRPVVGHLCQY